MLILREVEGARGGGVLAALFAMICWCREGMRETVKLPRPTGRPREGMMRLEVGDVTEVLREAGSLPVPQSRVEMGATREDALRGAVVAESGALTRLLLDLEEGRWALRPLVEVEEIVTRMSK